MNRKIILVFILSIFLFSFISASLPLVKQNDCVQIRTILNTDSVNLSSITYPNETTLFLNEEMTKNALTFNYTFCGTNVLGTYVYDYFDASLDTYTNDFLVTPSGNITTTGESILYFIIVIVMFVGSIILFYFILTLPYKNPRDNQDVVIEITMAKYLKVFLIAILYPIVITILNLMNGLAVNFTSLTIFAGIIGFFFEILLRVAWIWTLLIIFWFAYLIIRDTNLKKLTKHYEGYLKSL